MKKIIYFFISRFFIPLVGGMARTLGEISTMAHRNSRKTERDL